MEVAGIVIDSWKLEIFTRHLNQSGFKFVNAGTLAKGATTVLKVEAKDYEKLSGVVKAAHTECTNFSGRTLH